MSGNFFGGEDVNASSLKYFTNAPGKENKISKANNA
jgi:hypothetical protein